jgi:ABC-type transporter Mla subunit MlaD
MSDEIQWSGPASDTGNVLDGTSLGALLGSNGAAAGFSINYEALPQAIADLEAAADFFDDRANTALRLANILPPGIDGVSVNATAQLGKWAADDGVNNLHATLIAGAKQTRDLAQKLRDELKTYLQVEELNIPKASPGLPL